MENQYRVGLLRMERAIKERMSSVEIDTIMPQDLINAKPAAAAVREFFGSIAAVAVHGPDQPAVRSDAQAPPVGPWAGRSDPRTCRLRSARRPPDPLWPDVPDRDAGRPEHRPDQLAGHLCPREQVRLHRNPVPQGDRRQGDRRGRLHVGDRGNAPHRRPGQRGAGRRRPLHRRPDLQPEGRANSC